MKVNIGNYPTRLICNIHTKHMEKKYGFMYADTNKATTRFDNFLEVIEDSMQSVYDVFNWIWFDRRNQKVKVHIDRWDTWSMDHTISHIILPMLVQLKRDKHGAPMVSNADVPKKLRASKKQIKSYSKKGKTDPKHFERWDWILDEMIWAFNQKCRDDWEGDYCEYKDDTAQSGLKLVWEDREASNAHQVRMTNGFRLFGVYFENLWD